MFLTIQPLDPCTIDVLISTLFKRNMIKNVLNNTLALDNKTTDINNLMIIN